ncbi:uncharacterized protein LOC132559365 [Ylistrum balloti]|uniref:uncharacterized protein LOC132559365 n=1 Tax=Ylistrum balloti TaxID=509963 RepID=UPI002905A29C|nr:uncharacterized protein LOC132559365 [Ylistrum balloti]
MLERETSTERQFTSTQRRLEREYLEREERALRRSKEKEEREEEKHKMELEEAERDRQEAEKSRLFEMEKLNLQADIEFSRLKAEQEKSALSMSNSEESRSRSLRPKLPKFDEQKDDMDEFLERFEKFATAQHWNEDIWAVSLSPLLTGKGLQVYSSMPATQINKYDELKKALLRRYALTEEGFRVKFRDSKPEKGETAFQFVARLSRYLTRWTHMSEIEQSFEGLSDLLIRERFMQACSTDMVLFLKERAPKSVEELTRLAEQYMEAHGGSITESGKVKFSNPNKTHFPSRRNNQQQQSDQSTDTKGQKTRRCFICGDEGHIARDHAEVGKIGSKPLKSSHYKDSSKATLCQSVQALRDTGGSSAAIREALVMPDQMTDKKLPCILIDGTERMFRTARIFVDTPFYVGELEAMCMSNPVYDLVIGNIDGAKLTADAN